MAALWVTGLLALLGAFFGAFLARRTEYLKWLQQNRSEAFAGFLGRLFDAQDTAISVLHDTSLDAFVREITMTEAYVSVENYGYIVRLYLPEKYRGEFARLIREIRTLHCSVDLGDSRLNQMQKKIDRIQEIFESVVHPKWYERLTNA